jgi:hypothetical protein
VNELEPLCPDAPRLVPEARFPRYRFVPELHPHPRRSLEGSLYGQPEHAPGRPAADWRADPTYLFGIDLYHQGYLWESHEAFEACYFATDDATHRELLQALIQLAAAELQLHRGVANGVRILSAKARGRFQAVAQRIAPDEWLCGLSPGQLAVDVGRRFVGVTDGDAPLRTGSEPVRLAVDLR